MDFFLENRKLPIVQQLNGRKDQHFDKQYEVKGSKYELVSCKIYRDKNGNKYQSAEEARLIYAKIGESDSIDSFCIRDHLLRIGDFTKLKSRKIAARLELLQSPSSLNIVFLDASYFSDVSDRGYVGGGFIQENRMVEVLKQAGMTTAKALKVSAIQVRILIPSMGIYKGMLVKKRYIDGEAPIQLPCSMQKVPQSAHPQALKGAALLICKNGIHPSSSSANEYIGRQLDPTRKAPPKKSFEQKINKPLTNMVFRLWKTMGVSRELCDEYKKTSLKAGGRKHAWLVGVPDPTNSLPLDSIFVPGMKAIQPTELFVTRSPCYAYEHGRKLKNITTKPENMSDEDWEFLNNKIHFGVIIFSNPKPDKKSIPERIASGDLDGDLYLVCWDEKILSVMEAVELENEDSEDDGKLKIEESNPNWFEDTQDIMTDIGMTNNMGRLVSKLYTLGEESCDKDTDLILKNPDANAFYEAYNQALEYKKHGCPIELPVHLIKKLPANLRDLVQISGSTK